MKEARLAASFFQLEGISVSHVPGTAYSAAGGEDLILRYSGFADALVRVESSQVLTLGGAVTLWTPSTAHRLRSAAVEAYMLAGEAADGEFALELNIFYRYFRV